MAAQKLPNPTTTCRVVSTPKIVKKLATEESVSREAIQTDISPSGRELVSSKTVCHNKKLFRRRFFLLV
jgi:hypothetical protein